MSVNVALKLQYVLFPASVPELDWRVGNAGAGEQITFWNDALGAQPDAATLDAITAQQLADAMLTKERAEISALVISNHRLAVAIRALALAVLDELNAHSEKTNALLDAIDAAASLATLKTSVASIADLPTRTKAQLLTAVQGKASTGEAE